MKPNGFRNRTFPTFTRLQTGVSSVRNVRPIYLGKL